MSGRIGGKNPAVANPTKKQANAAGPHQAQTICHRVFIGPLSADTAEI
jgi:hypothetical protein